MNFLLDQDVYARTERFLRDKGYDLVRVSALGMAQASDEVILSVAQDQERILITRDRDYGNLVFVRSQGAGVIYLRMVPSTLDAVHHEFNRVITQYSMSALRSAFVVVTKDGHRFRTVNPGGG